MASETREILVNAQAVMLSSQPGVTSSVLSKNQALMLGNSVTGAGVAFNGIYPNSVHSLFCYK